MEFKRSIEDYSPDSIFFFHGLINKSKTYQPEEQDSYFSFNEHAKPLDLFNYWEKKKEENYSVLMTKVAYVLDQPVHFFSKERLSDLQYIQQTMPEAKIQKTDSIYHVSVGFGAPEIDYTLHFFTAQTFQQKHPELRTYFQKYDNLNEDPQLVVVQHNYDYGKVMFQKTSKMSISLSRYFLLNEQQTLVINYTLNYIHNFPPGFVGGSDLLLEKIKTGIKALVRETQKIAEE